MNYELENKLKQIKIENYIWVIYIGIIFLSWYSNNLEKNYYLYNNLKSKQNYRYTLIIIFTILLIIYFYFVMSAYDDYKNIKPTDSNQKKNLVFLSLLGSLLIFISGVIFLYIAYTDQDLNVEIAFN